MRILPFCNTYPAVSTIPFLSFRLKQALYFGIVLLILSCSPGKADDKSFRLFVTDTSVSHRSGNEVDFSILKSRELNLPQIHGGVDSFELRIWVRGISEPSQCLILRYADTKWIFTKYNCFTTANLVDSVCAYRNDIPPGIDSLVAYLQQPEILALPSQVAIPGFLDNISDGQTCTIEISTKSFYKALEYHCAEHFDEKYNRQFMAMIRILNGYFKFYYPWCKPTTL